MSAAPTIRVKCGNCKKTLSVKEQYAGKKVKCPACANIVAVPTGTGQHGALVTPLPKEPAKKPFPADQPPAAGKIVSVGGKKTAPDAKKPNSEPKKPTETKKPAAPGVKKPTPPKPEPTAPPPEEVEAEALSVFSEKEATPEVEEAPKIVTFRCEWCDEEVSLPIDQAGKQTPCPNPDCRRIVKVPVPKAAEKKDWRKVNKRSGPSGAMGNQVEVPDDVWDKADVSKVKTKSLEQAGAVEVPPKPRRGLSGWVLLFGKFVCVMAVLGVVGYGVNRLSSTSQQNKTIKELEDTLRKIPPEKSRPVLLAEGQRTIALCSMFAQDSRPLQAQHFFLGALAFCPAEFPKDQPGINEQLFLIELALSQIELGGDEEEVIANRKQPWELVQIDVASTLSRIQNPEVQVMALREVTTRLLAKKQLERALGLAGTWSTKNAGKYPIAYRQQIALSYWNGKHADLEIKLPDLQALKELTDSHARVGYAEGFARKGEYDKAAAIIKLENGAPEDYLEGYLGVAAIAMQEPKNKDEADKALKECMKIVLDPKVYQWSPWLMLHTVKLGARLWEPAANAAEWEDLKKMVERLDKEFKNKEDVGPFKMRAHLEIFLAKCDKATGPVSLDDPDFELLETKDKDGTTLALAWFAVAQQHARKGKSGKQIQQTFNNRLGGSPFACDRDVLSPMVEIGAVLGSLKY